MASYIVLSCIGILAAPIASAQTAAAEVGRIINILSSFINIVNLLVIIAVGCAFLFFFWNLATFILNTGGGKEGLDEAKKKIFWGLLAIFVLTSIWGLVYFLGLILLGSGSGGPGNAGNTNIESLRLPRGSPAAGSVVHQVPGSLAHLGSSVTHWNSLSSAHQSAAITHLRSLSPAQQSTAIAQLSQISEQYKDSDPSTKNSLIDEWIKRTDE